MLGRSETSFNLNDIHIVGFSLGAQVAGKAGETLNSKVGRITGLDPAGIYFLIYSLKPYILKLPGAKSIYRIFVVILVFLFVAYRVFSTCRREFRGV